MQFLDLWVSLCTVWNEVEFSHSRKMPLVWDVNASVLVQWSECSYTGTDAASVMRRGEAEDSNNLEKSTLSWSVSTELTVEEMDTINCCVLNIIGGLEICIRMWQIKVVTQKLLFAILMFCCCAGTGRSSLKLLIRKELTEWKVAAFLKFSAEQSHNYTLCLIVWQKVWAF